MGEGSDGLGVVDVGAHPHGAGGVVGQAVGAAAVAAGHGEPALGYEAGQGVPQAGRSLAGQQPGRGRGGQRFPGGLGDVPDVGGAEPDDAARLRARVDPDRLRRRGGGGAGGGSRGVGGVGPAGHRGEDHQPLLALGHLPAELLPGGVAGDGGGVGLLREQ